MISESKHTHDSCSQMATFVFRVHLLGCNFSEQFESNFEKNRVKTVLSHFRSWCESYGEVYFRAWQQTSGVRQQKLEQNCIQDLMYHAVHAHHTLLPNLKKVRGFYTADQHKTGLCKYL